MSALARRALVDRSDPHVSVAAQCRLLRVARSTLYYRPAAVSEDEISVVIPPERDITPTEPAE